MSKMIWFGIFKPSKMLTFYIIYVVSRCEHLIWQCHINWSVCMLILLGNSIINSQTASIFTLILDSLCAKLSGPNGWFVFITLLLLVTSQLDFVIIMYISIAESFNWNVITCENETLWKNSHAFHCLWWEVARWMNVHGLGHQCNCWTDWFFSLS